MTPGLAVRNCELTKGGKRGNHGGSALIWGWKGGLGCGWCRCGEGELTLRVMDGLDSKRLRRCVERAVRGGKGGGREGRMDWIWLDHWKSKRRWGRDGESSRCGKGNEMGGKGNGIWKSKRDWVNELVSSGDGKERWYGERNRRFGVIWG